MSEFCLVLCTCPNPETGRNIARQAVEQKLAACVNLIPGLESIYAWQGAIEQDEEVQLVFKTAQTKVDELHKLVLRLHPYDEPEWLVVDIQSGSRSYLDWMRSSLR